MEADSRARYELHVCIVNWRTPGLTIDCLRSIAGERAQTGLRVTVVDNASGDGSDEQIRSAVGQNGWQDWVHVISAPRNGGFAYGNNVAIRDVLSADPGARFLLLLNPDTVVRPGALRILLDFMLRHPQVGLAGGVSENLDGTPQHCSFRFFSLISEFAGYARLGLLEKIAGRWLVATDIPIAATQVDWVSGAVLMIRREVIDQIGLLDESYFLYFEETDFILRARRAGWPCWHVPESRVVHLVGQSSGVKRPDAAPKRLPAYWFESRRRYFAMNHGRTYAVLADLAAMAGYVVWRAGQFVRGRFASDPPHFIPDLLRHGAIRHGQRAMAPRKTAL